MPVNGIYNIFMLKYLIDIYNSNQITLQQYVISIMSMQKTPKFCWGCGKPLKPGQKFCTFCGKKVKIEGSPLNTALPNNAPRVAPHVASKYNQRSSSISKQPSNLYGRSTQKDVLPQNRISASTPVSGSTPISGTAAISVSSPTSASNSIASSDSNSYIRTKVDSIENILTQGEVKSNFERLDYKLNSLNMENKLVDIEHAINDLKIKTNQVQELVQTQQIENSSKSQSQSVAMTEDLKEKLDSVASKEDLREVYDRIDALDISTFSTIDARLSQIENKVSSPLLDSEQTINLAKNTVTRLNSIEEKLDTNNLEIRTRLHRLDEKIQEFDSRIERFTNNLELLVPSLVKLTEKINQLQEKVTLISKKTSSIERRQKALDLPPFPQNQSQKVLSPDVSSLDDSSSITENGLSDSYDLKKKQSEPKKDRVLEESEKESSVQNSAQPLTE